MSAAFSSEFRTICLLVPNIYKNYENNVLFSSYVQEFVTFSDKCRFLLRISQIGLLARNIYKNYENVCFRRTFRSS